MMTTSSSISLNMPLEYYMVERPTRVLSELIWDAPPTANTP